MEAEGHEMVAKECTWHCPVQPVPSWLFNQVWARGDSGVTSVPSPG